MCEKKLKLPGSDPVKEWYASTTEKKQNHQAKRKPDNHYLLLFGLLRWQWETSDFENESETSTGIDSVHLDARVAGADNGRDLYPCRDRDPDRGANDPDLHHDRNRSHDPDDKLHPVHEKWHLAHLFHGLFRVCDLLNDHLFSHDFCRVTLNAVDGHTLNKLIEISDQSLSVFRIIFNR